MDTSPSSSAVRVTPTIVPLVAGSVIAPPFATLTPRRLVHGASGRDEAESMVREVFARVHGARIDSFYPMLLGFEANDGLQAVVGVRTLCDGEGFFSEQYLDAPIDALLAARTGASVDRCDIAEIGNLACLYPGDARWLIAAVTAYLYGAGHRWVLFTATTPLYNAFRRIGLQPTRLAPADRARLADPSSEWGRYYHLDPQVCVGDIHTGFELLRSRVRHGPVSMQRLWQKSIDAGLRLSTSASPPCRRMVMQ